MTKARELTPEDILAVKSKYGIEHMIKPDFNKLAKNKNGDTYYMDIQIKYPDGEYGPLVLKYKQIVIVSNAKCPIKKRTRDMDKAEPGKQEIPLTDHLQVSMKKITESDLKESDYSEANMKVLVKNTNELLAALDVIDAAYVWCVENVLFTYDREPLDKVKIIRRFIQDKRDPTKDEIKKNDSLPDDKKFISKGKVAMPSIYRFRVGIDRMSHKIGYYNNKTKRFVYTVFDLRNPKKISGKLVYSNAKIKRAEKRNGKTVETIEDIDDVTAKSYITYLSVVSGLLEIPQINTSSQGATGALKSKTMYICPHRKLESEQMSEQDLMDISTIKTNGYDDNYEPDEEVKSENGDEEEAEESEEESPKSKKTSKKSEDDEESPKSKKTSKKSEDDEESPKSKKTSKKAKEESEEEAEESDADEEPPAKPVKGKKEEDNKKEDEAKAEEKALNKAVTQVIESKPEEEETPKKASKSRSTKKK